MNLWNISQTCLTIIFVFVPGPDAMYRVRMTSQLEVCSWRCEDVRTLRMTGQLEECGGFVTVV